MADKIDNSLPRLTPEQRRTVAGLYERASQVLGRGDFDYAIPLLLDCCAIDPGNATYRQVLRQAAKNKYGNNLRGQKLSFVVNMRRKLQIRRAARQNDHLKVLEHGEHILVRNPWDIPTHLAMAEAFDGLGLFDLAVWTLEQSRQQDANNHLVNRPLARLYEKRGNFNQAIALWQLVRKADPTDVEAQNKAKDLAASATIAKGRYAQVLTGDAPTPMAQQLNVETEPSTPTSMAQATAEQPSAALTQKIPPSPGDDRIREAPVLYAKIAANPTNPNGYLHLAQLYRRLDMFAKAREVLEQGLGPTGKSFDVQMELADLEIEPFRRDLDLTEGKLRRDPDNADLLKIRTRLVKEIGTRELAYYREKADRMPTDTTSRFEMAIRLMKTGQLDEAIKELQGLRNDPRHQSKVLVYLGFCFKTRNNWRLAQRNFEESLQYLGANDEALRKEVLFQLAQGYADSGEFPRAVDLACELANLDFAYKNISQLLDLWQARLQKA